MGIAFLTSLIALVCSSILVFINLRCNTNLSTNWLISSLEDYLDNIFHPQVDGFTRLDKAIGRMVDRQEEFLLRFHEKVGEVLESSLTPVANRIAEENEKANRIATQVYQRFLEASGTLSSSAATFRDAVDSLQSQVTKIESFSNNLQLSAIEIETGAGVFREASQQIQNSNFSGRLEETTLLLVEITLGNTNGNWQSQTTNLSDVIVRENSFNKEYLKYISQALHQSLVSLNKLAEVKSN